MENGNSDYALACMDESYVNNMHSLNYSYMEKGKDHIERPSSKGKRLVILQAITKDGPLCEREDNGVPASQ